jgi:hypothetical protein
VIANDQTGDVVDVGPVPRWVRVAIILVVYGVWGAYTLITAFVLREQIPSFVWLVPTSAAAAFLGGGGKSRSRKRLKLVVEDDEDQG